MNDQQARQTPIIDLLRDIPADARMVYEVTPTHHQSIPVGVLAKNAADEIERLRAERDEHKHWRRELANKLHDRETEIIELRRQLAEAEMDAERYRWLRNEANTARKCDPMVCIYPLDEQDLIDGDRLDVAIDAAMGLTRPAEE